MLIQIPFSSTSTNVVNVNISFFPQTIKVFVEGSEYLVKWYKEGEFFGEMNLKAGFWGAFPNNGEIKDWKIEFWKDEVLVYTHSHIIRGSNVLLVPIETGLNEMETKNLIERKASEIQSLGGSVWVFLKNSHIYDFSSIGVKPMKLSKTPEMDFIIEI